jgi:hypothetical protein
MSMVLIHTAEDRLLQRFSNNLVGAVVSNAVNIPANMIYSRLHLRRFLKEIYHDASYVLVKMIRSRSLDCRCLDK